jgi:hypothetical protein
MLLLSVACKSRLYPLQRMHAHASKLLGPRAVGTTQHAGALRQHSHALFTYSAHLDRDEGFQGFHRQEFLAEAHKISEMHIYTHGNAEYAAEMARLLDPSRQYFAERIISQARPTQAPWLDALHTITYHQCRQSSGLKPVLHLQEPVPSSLAEVSVRPTDAGGLSSPTRLVHDGTWRSDVFIGR